MWCACTTRESRPARGASDGLARDSGVGGPWRASAFSLQAVCEKTSRYAVMGQISGQICCRSIYGVTLFTHRRIQKKKRTDDRPRACTQCTEGHTPASPRPGPGPRPLRVTVSRLDAIWTPATRTIYVQKTKKIDEQRPDPERRGVRSAYTPRPRGPDEYTTRSRARNIFHLVSQEKKGAHA